MGSNPTPSARYNISMKSKLAFVLFGTVLLGVLATYFLQQERYSKQQSYENSRIRHPKEFTSYKNSECSQACVGEGFTEGECVRWSSSMSPENWCKERNSAYTIADCGYDPPLDEHGFPSGGGGVVCCCE